MRISDWSSDVCSSDLLARMLGREFIDLDHELEARCGVRVPVIFEIEGEGGFRKREAAALEHCTQRRGIVLATGGGAVLRPDRSDERLVGTEFVRQVRSRWSRDL